MNVFEKMALSTAERLERHVGADSALATYRRLLARFPKGEARTQAALGALRCAERLGDASVVAEIAGAWRAMRDARPGDAIPTLTRALVRRGLDRAAADLASAEAERAPTARSLYLSARCRERVGDADALSLYRRAGELADAEPDAAAIGAAARARRVERLAADPERAKDALEEALAAPLEAATRAQKLAIAEVRLGAPSPYARASALSLLEELGRPRADRSPPLDEIARAAILVAARHADLRGDTIAPVEQDRIVAALRHWPDSEAREAAIARVKALGGIARASGSARDDAAAKAAVLDAALVPLLASAHAVLAGAPAGHGSVPAAAPTGVRLGASALDAVAALLRGHDDDASAALRRAASLVPNAGAVPPALAVAIDHGLARERTSVEAAELVETLLDARLGFPVRGHARLAAALRGARRDDLAVRVLRAGAAARDLDAIDDLSTDRVREAHRAVARGDRDGAIAALREAKALGAKR
jgi:hypothetical protein